MSYENVRKYLEEKNAVRFLAVHETTCDTVEHAAETIGCSIGEIAKTLSFLVDEKPILIVMAGDTRVNSSKFKGYFHQKPKMIPGDQVEALVGHEPGGVCPFAVKAGVPVYLDETLKRFPVVHAAGGLDTVTVGMSPAELEQYSSNFSGWVDVCKVKAPAPDASRNA